MTTTHTPGPLIADDAHSGEVWHIYVDAEEYETKVGEAYTEADGKLWAKAPEMLEALREILVIASDPAADENEEAVEVTLARICDKAGSLLVELGSLKDGKDWNTAIIAEIEGEK